MPKRKVSQTWSFFVKIHISLGAFSLFASGLLWANGAIYSGIVVIATSFVFVLLGISAERRIQQRLMQEMSNDIKRHYADWLHWKTGMKRSVSVRDRFLSIADILRFFLPHKIRKEIYEPYEEELKEDFFVASSKAHTTTGRFFIWMAFYFRLSISFIQSLVCWILGAFPSLFKILLGLVGAPKSK